MPAPTSEQHHAEQQTERIARASRGDAPTHTSVGEQRHDERGDDVADQQSAAGHADAEHEPERPAQLGSLRVSREAEDDEHDCETGRDRASSHFSTCG